MKRSLGFKVAMGLGIALAALLVFGLGGMKYTSRPSFCATCHQIKPSVVTWQQLSHKTVQCLDCHADPGTAGYVKRKIAGLTEVQKQLTGSYGEIKANFNEANCIKCHGGSGPDPKAKDVLAVSAEGTTRMKISHQTHLEEKLTCLSCHRRVAHGEKLDPKTSEPITPKKPQTMTTLCAKCHDVRPPDATSDDRTQWRFQESCTFCHKVEPRVASLPQVGS